LLNEILFKSLLRNNGLQHWAPVKNNIPSEPDISLTKQKVLVYPSSYKKIADRDQGKG